MKKYIVLIPSLVILFAAVSCAEKTAEEKIKEDAKEVGKSLKKLGKDVKEAAE